MTSHHVDALEVPCPHCSARWGHRCASPHDEVLTYYRHTPRHALAIHVEQMLTPSTSIAGHHDTDQEVTVTNSPVTLTAVVQTSAVLAPEAVALTVANVLAAHWPDVKVTAATSNAGQQRETLTEEQQAVLTAGRWMLGHDIPEDYRRGVLEMMALQMFGEPGERDRVTAHLDPWPPVDDTTLQTFGWLVVKTLREAPLEATSAETLSLIHQAARDLQIVFQI